ncbi:MAG: YcaO-like family protein [Thermoplasmata archaeon]|nr:YcaO-like family protein [Thermoplasmata archaeon]
MGIKVDSPANTINRISIRLKSYGILPTFKNYFTIGPVSIVSCSANIKDLETPIHSTWGKGIGPELAMASGIAELAERLSSRFLMSYVSDRVQQKVDEILGANKAHKSASATEMLFKDEYEGFKKKWKQYCPNEKPPPTCWQECHSLIDDKRYYYPENYISFALGGTGLASGNTLEEAIVHASCEVIERITFRHFCMSVKNNSIMSDVMRSRTIDLHSVMESDKRLAHAIEEIQRHGTKILLIDYSIWGIPTVIAFFLNYGTTFSKKIFPSAYRACSNRLIIGVDTSPVAAVTRCVTEYFIVAHYLEYYASQDYLLRAAGIEMRLPKPAPALSQWSTIDAVPIHKGLNIERYIQTADEDQRHNRYAIDINSSRMPNIYHVDLKTEIERLVDSLNKRNLELYVQDITQPWLDFPVVQVFPVIRKSKNELKHICSPLYFLGNPFRNERIDPLFHPLFGRYRGFRNTEIWDAFRALGRIGNLSNAKLESIRETLEGVALNVHIHLRSPKYPLGVNIYYLLIKINIKLKDYERAIRLVDAVLYIDPQSTFAQVAKIELLYRMKQYDLAEQFEKMLEIIYPSLEIAKERKHILDIPEAIIQDQCDIRLCKQKTDTHVCKQCIFKYIPTKQAN